MEKTTQSSSNVTYLSNNTTTDRANCSNDYCLSDEDYLAMIEAYIFPNTYEWILISLFALTFFIGLIGNFLVCFAIWRNRTMRTVTNIFIVNLAMSDLTVVIVCLPPTLLSDVTETWFMGLAMCKIALYLMNVSVSVSVLTLSAISVERWYAICHPLRFKSTVRRARFIILLIWIMSLFSGVPELVSAELIPTVSKDITSLLVACRPGWDPSSQAIYQIFLIVALYVLPLWLMGLMYAWIAMILWKSDIPGNTVGTRRHMANDKSKLDDKLEIRRKAAKMLITVVAVFALSYFPVHLINILRYAGVLRNLADMSIIALVSHWFPYFNSSINPIIYNFMSAKFRKEFANACFCCPRIFRGAKIRSRPQTYTFTSTHANNRYASKTEQLTLSTVQD